MRKPLLQTLYVSIILLSVLSCNTSAAILDWVWKVLGTNSDEDSSNQVVRTGLKFEVQTADNKFLQLKDVLENLSDLDACNHIVRKTYKFNVSIK